MDCLIISKIKIYYKNTKHRLPHRSVPHTINEKLRKLSSFLFNLHSIELYYRL